MRLHFIDGQGWRVAPASYCIDVCACGTSACFYCKKHRPGRRAVMRAAMRRGSRLLALSWNAQLYPGVRP